MKKDSKIYVAGHKGLVGSAVVRKLKADGYTNIITRTRKELDLLDQTAVKKFFETEKPEYVIDSAAKVGGIIGNSTFPADFIYQNIQIQNNLIHSAHEVGVKKFLFLGSSCIYPKEADIPIKEESLLTGPLEESNEAYAIAKIAGIMMCKKYYEQYGDVFISAQPTNLYGINDNFHPKHSHLVPGIMRRMHEAKIEEKEEVVIWGSGKPMRELLYVDDLADALVYLANNYEENEIINVGTGGDITIREIAETIKNVVGYKGKLTFDTSKPDGTFRKVMDVSRLLETGWKPKHSLKEGLEKTYTYFSEEVLKA